MSIPFTKMHGLGNDYIYVDCLNMPGPNAEHAPALARAMSDRHRGIGSDGLILIRPPDDAETADCRMEMYNADGSRGEMCGNGIRCVAKYVLDRRLAGRVDGDVGTLGVQTDRGILKLNARLVSGVVETVRVAMGPPILRPADIPMRSEGDRCVRHTLSIDGQQLTITAVSMGNPHAVAFVDSFDGFDLVRLGPLVEHHELFPNRVNFHAVTVQSNAEATMKTWERGSGITQACGSGACAVLVAGVLEGRLERRAVVLLPGGDLSIAWPDGATDRGIGCATDRGTGVSPVDHPQDAGATPGSVFMTGSATEVFSGVWPT